MEDHKPPRWPAFLLQNLWGYLWLADVLSDPSQGSERVQGQSCFHCSVTQSYLIFWDPMDCSTPDFPVLHPLPSPGVCWNSYSLSQWCHPAISSSVVLLSSCPQSFPESGSFLMSQLFSSGGQSIGALASALVLPMNIQGWFPLGLTGLIFLQSRGLSRVFSNTTVQKHQFFGVQPSLWSYPFSIFNPSELFKTFPQRDKLH